MNDALKGIVNALNEEARILNVCDYGNGKNCLQLNDAKWVDELAKAHNAHVTAEWKRMNGENHGPLYASHKTEIDGVTLFGIESKSDAEGGISKSEMLAIVTLLDKCGAYPYVSGMYDGNVIMADKLRDIARTFGAELKSKTSVWEENGAKRERLYYYAVIDGIRFEEAA